VRFTLSVEWDGGFPGMVSGITGCDLVTMPIRVVPPRTPPEWMAGLTERDRYEWWHGDRTDPIEGLASFCEHYALPVRDLTKAARKGTSRYGVGLLVGAAACAAAAGADPGPESPCRAVPDLAAVAFEVVNEPEQAPARFPVLSLGEWATSWSDTAHAAAVSAVREAIGRGEVYQVNVVGHRSAPYTGDPAAALRAVTALPGAVYGGGLAGAGWAVATASPECLLSVAGGVVRTHPIKGTRPATAAGRAQLLADPKERAEHVMIVDLERNDLSRVAVTGSVAVPELFAVREWCGLWQAESVVSARLRPSTGLVELLRALLPGGSVTGAPKLAALAQIRALEPVGRGPAMGALGFFTADRLDLGLTIRTVAADADRLHVWAGGGITWGSDPDSEVAEAHAKAGPLLAAIAGASVAGAARP
jgi:para-aminobenzoate synthetase component 1